MLKARGFGEGGRIGAAEAGDVEVDKNVVPIAKEPPGEAGGSLHVRAQGGKRPRGIVRGLANRGSSGFVDRGGLRNLAAF